MEKIILVVHVLAALAIIGLILLQQGKGAEMGASFGSGASQTVFGSQGSGNFFTRTTTLLAVVFFATSFGLAVVAKQNAKVATEIGIPVLEESKEAPIPVEESEIPSFDGESAADAESDSDIPVLDSDAAEPVSGDASEEAAGDVPAVEDNQQQ